VQILKKIVGDLLGRGGICSNEKALRANAVESLLKLLRDFPEDKRSMFSSFVEHFAEITQTAVFETIAYWKANGVSSGKTEGAPFDQDSLYSLSESLGIMLSEAVLGKVNSLNCSKSILSLFVSEYEKCVCQDIKNLNGDVLTKGTVVARLLTCIGNLSKAFKVKKGQIHEIAPVFETVLQSTLQIMFSTGSEELNSQHEDFRQSVIFYLHRMVDTMGLMLLNSVGQILLAFLQTSTASSFQNTLSLISQMVAKFEGSFADVLDAIWLQIISKYHEYIISDFNGSEASRNDPAKGYLYSKSKEFRQQLVTFCATIIKKSCGNVFLSSRNVLYITDFLGTIHEVYTSFPDPNLMKGCFFVFKSILEMVPHSADRVSQDAVIKLHQMMIHQILPVSVMMQTRLDLNDAQSNSLMRDFIKFHGELQNLWGDEVSFSILKLLGEHGVQQDVAQYYVSNLRVMKPDQLKQILFPSRR
jgi:hypothetical protein